MPDNDQSGWKREQYSTLPNLSSDLIIHKFLYPVTKEPHNGITNIYIVKEAFRPKHQTLTEGWVSSVKPMDKQKQRQDTKTYRRNKDKGKESK